MCSATQAVSCGVASSSPSSLASVSLSFQSTRTVLLFHIVVLILLVVVLYQFFQLFPRRHFSHMFSLYSHGFLDVVFTLTFSMNDSCCPNKTTFPSSTIALTEANGLWTSASRKFILNFIPSLMNSHLASPATRMGLPFAAANFTVLVDFVLSTHFFRLGQTLLAAPESTVISTTSCTVSIAYTFRHRHFRSQSMQRTSCVHLHSSSRPPPPEICTSFSSNENRIHHPDLHEFY